MGCTGATVQGSIRDAIVPLSTTASGSAGASSSALVKVVPVRISVVPPAADINVPAPAGFAGPRIPSSIRLTGTVYNSDGSISTDILWTSSDPRLARVDPDGVVTSLLPTEVGTVLITGASRLDPALVPISDGSLSSDLLWSSSDVNIAKVDQQGLVSSAKIRSAGTAILTAQSRFDPTKKATASITVVDNGEVEIDVQ